MNVIRILLALVFVGAVSSAPLLGQEPAPPPPAAPAAPSEPSTPAAPAPPPDDVDRVTYSRPVFRLGTPYVLAANGSVSEAVIVMSDATIDGHVRGDVVIVLGSLRLGATVFNTREPIMITDTDGVILDVNQAFLAVFGYSRNQVLGKTPAILQSGHHDDDFYAAFWKHLAEDGYWQQLATFCLALTDKRSQVDFNIDLLREIGTKDYAYFSLLPEVMGDKAKHKGLPAPQPQHSSMLAMSGVHHPVGP